MFVCVCVYDIGLVDCTEACISGKLVNCDNLALKYCAVEVGGTCVCFVSACVGVLGWEGGTNKQHLRS